MTCSDKCIHFPVCEPKKYDFANIDECQYYEEQRPHGEWEYLKELITDVRDADGRPSQKGTCQYILNLMEVIERGR